MTKATLHDVAKLAGVHYATASRALGGRTSHLVNARTLERVVQAATDLGYVANSAARSLRINRTATLGVMVNDISASIVGELVRGIEDIVVPAGYLTLVVNSDDDESREAARVDSLVARNIDGLIVTSARFNTSKFDELAATGLPIVLANRRLAESTLPSVTGDDASGIRAAVDHLVGLGHTRIAHIAGQAESSTGRARAEAFRDAVRRHGLEVDEDLITVASTYTSEEGRTQLAGLLSRRRDFTAVVAANDALAIGGYDALRDAGLECPRDISIVGFNNVPLTDKLRPALTTVSVPHREIGREAARILMAWLESGEPAAKTVLLPVSLIVRESTAPPVG
jgi:LacI family transcriptional regulator